MDRAAVDEDGTPSVYKIHAKNLKRHSKYASEIVEKQSMDWRATQTAAQTEMDEITRNMAFIPRLGELVLYASGLGTNRLEVSPTSRRIEVYDPKAKTFQGRPDWRAGVVAQTPSTNTPLNYLDILKNTDQSSRSITYTGFRLESVPDPNITDRISQQTHEYASMSQIRPLSMWQIFLQGASQPSLHPSIQNALSLTSTVSLALKTKFTGIWPRAIISCGALYAGAELYIKDDAVRFSTDPPSLSSEEDDTEISSILVIRHIHLNLTFTDANLLDTTPLAQSASITLLGHGYTTSPEDSYLDNPCLTPILVKAKLPQGLADYGPWYPLNDEQDLITVPFHHVLGRCYETAALSLMLGTSHYDLMYDLPAILSQRAFATARDPRIAESETWFWGDTRAQALSLTQLNGEDIGPFDETRDPTMWRGILRVVDGTARQQDIRDAKVLTQRGRPGGGGRKPSILAMGVGLGGATEDDSAESIEADSMDMDIHD